MQATEKLAISAPAMMARYENNVLNLNFLCNFLSPLCMDSINGRAVNLGVQPLLENAFADVL